MQVQLNTIYKKAVYGYVRSNTQSIDEIVPYEIYEMCFAFYYDKIMAQKELKRKLNVKIRQRPSPEYLKMKGIVNEIYLDWIYPHITGFYIGSDNFPTIQEAKKKHEMQQSILIEELTSIYGQRSSPEEMVKKGIFSKELLNVIIGNKDLNDINIEYKQCESDSIDEQIMILKEWMNKNNVYDHYLYDVLIINAIDSSKDLEKLSTSRMDEMLRKVRSDKFIEITDENGRNEIDELLLKFERKWKILKKRYDDEVKIWMKRNNVFYKYLYHEFELNNIKKLNDLKNLNVKKLDKILRKVRSKRFGEVKNENSRNKIDQKLLNFERKWRKLTQ